MDQIYVYIKWVIRDQVIRDFTLRELNSYLASDLSVSLNGSLNQSLYQIHSTTTNRKVDVTSDLIHTKIGDGVYHAEILDVVAKAFCLGADTIIYDYIKVCNRDAAVDLIVGNSAKILANLKFIPSDYPFSHRERETLASVALALRSVLANTPKRSINTAEDQARNSMVHRLLQQRF